MTFANNIKMLQFSTNFKKYKDSCLPLLIFLSNGKFRTYCKELNFEAV